MKLNELEVKLAIESEALFEKAYETCCTLFGIPASPTLQLDEYYDTNDNQLQKQDLVIRIRSDGKKQIIALKSPRVHLPSGMNERIELEFLADAGENVRKQLIDQGLKAREASEKRRWTFVYQDYEIVLDQLPFIGYFIEIEGSSEEAIAQMIERLELSSCPVIRKNYGELIREKLSELQLPLSNISATFEKEKELGFESK